MVETFRYTGHLVKRKYIRKYLLTAEVILKIVILITFTQLTVLNSGPLKDDSLHAIFREVHKQSENKKF